MPEESVSKRRRVIIDDGEDNKEDQNRDVNVEKSNEANTGTNATVLSKQIKIIKHNCKQN